MGTRFRAPHVVLVCLSAVLALVASACADVPGSPTPGPGLTSVDVRLGTGAEATSGQRLTVDYTLWLFDAGEPEQKGILLETSRGTQPFTFTLGAGVVIAGWDVGLPGMRQGGVRRLIIPPSLAYGARRQQVIPAFSTLVFDVELLAVEAP
jgi:FKBP-type peptidyl-prolyl cis-trans isomerase